MDALFRIGLQNACWALALALAAALGVRVWRRRPAVAHTLWLLVLLKLLTPSVVGISLQELWRHSAETLARNQPRVTGDEAASPPIGQPLPEGASALKSASPARLYREPRAERADDVRSAEGHSSAERKETLEVGQATGERPGEGANSPVPTKRSAAAQFESWKEVAIGLWVVGAVACWSIIVLGAYRFRRHAALRPGGARGHQESRTGSRRVLGPAASPGDCDGAGRVGPMVWAAMAGRPRLLLPEELWARLDSTQQDAVLTHELAHLKRRDHWVRRIETVVLALYWWFPVAWWTRRELERTEEACCDAWVLWAMPDGAAAYADALVATAAFLSGHRQMLPPGAISACRTLAIQRRLNVILSAASPRSPVGNAPRVLLVLGVLSLPFLPGLAPGRAPAAAPQDAAAAAPAANPNVEAPGEVVQKAAKERAPFRRRSRSRQTLGHCPRWPFAARPKRRSVLEPSLRDRSRRPRPWTSGRV